MDDSSTGKQGNTMLFALVGCGALLFVGLCVALGLGVYFFLRDGAPGLNDLPSVPQGEPIAPPTDVPQAPQSFMRQADITHVTGTLSGRVSGSCTIVVAGAELQGQPVCVTQITCDGIVVYGGGSSGYFPCRLDTVRRSVSGIDSETTSTDGDGAMTIDTDSRTLQIRDDPRGVNGEFTLAATIR